MGTVDKQRVQKTCLKIAVLVGAATFAMIVISTSDFAYYVPDMAAAQMGQSHEDERGTKTQTTQTKKVYASQMENTAPVADNSKTQANERKGFPSSSSSKTTVDIIDQSRNFSVIENSDENGDSTVKRDVNEQEDFRSANQRLSAINGKESNETSTDEERNELVNQYQLFPVLHRKRIHNLHNACNTPTLFEKQMYKGKNSTKFYSSLKYNFSYCKVPKSGSTFWAQVFAVLKYGLQNADHFFRETRSKVHATDAKFMLSFNIVKTSHLRTVLVSRDPYSRLYSAYVDKVYLPLMFNINFDILGISSGNKDVSHACPTNVTFQQFLDWVIDKGRKGHTLNRHWAPIVSLCRPCDVNAFVLVKQETFSQDVEFVLSQVGAEKNIQDYILKALHGHRAEFSLPGIIDTYYRRMSSQMVKQCYTFRHLARRIWKSFQIQGYINELILFPEEKITLDNRAANNSVFSDIVLQTIREHPMTSPQSKFQRHKFLYEAYRSIPPETIAGLQELYEQDFEMFGYSKQPPSDNV